MHELNDLLRTLSEMPSDRFYAVLFVLVLWFGYDLTKIILTSQRSWT